MLKISLRNRRFSLTWFLPNNPNVIPQPPNIQRFQIIPVKEHLNTKTDLVCFILGDCARYQRGGDDKDRAGVRIIKPLDELDTSGLSTA